MYNKLITRLILTITLLLTAGILFSYEIKINGEDNWSLISTFSNTSTRIDYGGFNALRLSDNEYQPNHETELLFHFNDDFLDSAGNYSTAQNTGVFLSANTKQLGAASAGFAGDGENLRLIPHEASAFAAGSGRLNNFTIEFWLNPSRLSEGESILFWTGALKTADRILQQEILVGVSRRTLFWEFKNFFLPPDMTETMFRLSTSDSIIPGRWHHHMVRYESKTGLLEYLIDGTPEDITYVSADGRESSEVYFPFPGAAKPTAFTIGREYTGFLDELRITNSFEKEPKLDRYSMENGRVVSEIIDLEYADSRVFKLSTREKTPGKTQIYYYYRLSNYYFDPHGAYPPWKQLLPDEMLSPEVKGRYLQVAAELLPDGSGKETPLLSGMKISYEENLPPQPPVYISAKAANGRVSISWQPIIETDTAGYKVYYGSRPGNYFGTDAAEGNSPIDAGNTSTIEISGLENGKLYYFAVTSYDDAELPHESEFSREVSSRPSKMFREYE